MDKHEEFLKEDFNQCHEWMRHYNSSFTSITNFYYTGFVAILTADYVLYSGFPTNIEASIGVTILLFFGSLLSPIFLYWLMKNRVYFTKTARWGNEIREAYLKQEPLEVKNKSKIYTNYKSPSYYNPGSTHSIFLYFTALCSSILATLTYSSILRTADLKAGKIFEYPFYSSIFITVVVYVAYMLWIIFYLRSKEVENGSS
jgi:hypothetical protein